MTTIRTENGHRMMANRKARRKTKTYL